WLDSCMVDPQLLLSLLIVSARYELSVLPGFRDVIAYRGRCVMEQNASQPHEARRTAEDQLLVDATLPARFVLSEYPYLPIRLPVAVSNPSSEVLVDAIHSVSGMWRSILS